MEELGGLQSMGLQESDMTQWLSHHATIHTLKPEGLWLWLLSVSSFTDMYLFIYLAALGLSCNTWDLCCVIVILTLSSCGILDYLLGRHMGFLVSWPGIKPLLPALQSRFLTAGPPGNSEPGFLMVTVWWRFWSFVFCLHLHNSLSVRRIPGL